MSVALLGKYLCYALLAVALDLVWGYCGILSLGHGAFFALGGYAMGMYLMRQIGTRGVYAQSDPARLHGVPELEGTARLLVRASTVSPTRMLMVLLVPGLLAFVFGWFAFRSRVTGVYLSIITQAMTYALLLAFFRNDMGFGGNNGLTDFKDILGFNVQAHGTRAALFVATAIALVARLSARPRRGRRRHTARSLIAIRDAESRTRFLGYRVEHYKLLVFTISAVMAGVAGALYVPQVGIINPSEFAPANSIEAVIWVAVGGRGTLVGAALGAVVGQLSQDAVLTGALPELLAVRARRAVHLRHAVPAARASSARSSKVAIALRGRAQAAPPSVCSPRSRFDDRREQLERHPGAALSRRRQRQLRRLSRRLRGLSLVLAPGEMRAIIGPNGAGKTTMMDVITGKTRPDDGDVYFARHARSDRARRGGDRRARHRPQIPEADGVREPHGRRQHPAGAEGAALARFATLFGRARPPSSAQRIDDILETIAPDAITATASPARSVARPEAMARDRHAAGAGPEAPARRRAGRRHDRRGDRSRPPRCCKRHRQGPLRRRGRARHGLRARARRAR